MTESRSMGYGTYASRLAMLLHRSLEENGLFYFYMKARLLLSLTALTIALSMPSLLRIPRVLPFLDPEVRAAAPQMLEELRARGLWLVNVDIESVTKEDEKWCIHFVHRYTSRKGTRAPEPITTCKK